MPSGPHHKHESPLVLRQRLRVTLRNLREDRGLTEREVAVALGWQPLSKLLRVERGSIDISVRDLCVLLNHYGVEDDDLVEELIQTASHAQRQPQYEKFRDILPSEYMYFLQYESSASVFFRSFDLSVVPGLLQTEEYARKYFFECYPVTPNSKNTLERRVELRMHRQKALDRAVACGQSSLWTKRFFTERSAGPP